MAQVKTETIHGMAPLAVRHNYAEWRKSKPDIKNVREHEIQQKVIQDDESPRPLTRPNAYFMVVEYEEDE
jgi:hypothetical protein